MHHWWPDEKAIAAPNTPHAVELRNSISVLAVGSDHKEATGMSHSGVRSWDALRCSLLALVGYRRPICHTGHLISRLVQGFQHSNNF